MHKYQPRIHVIRTNDLSQIPWAPQQPFVFPETEFVAQYENGKRNCQIGFMMELANFFNVSFEYIK